MTVHPVTPRTLDWLRTEVGHWSAEGLVSGDQATAILGRYRASRRFGLAGLVLTLGSIFVGTGLIWLVASNLDSLPPIARFLVVAAFWIAVTVLGEWLATQREHSGTIPSPVVAAARLLSALLIGAVIFQAAQSLQVPAYEPKLVGLWGAAALVHAYLMRTQMPLTVGIVALTVWFIWQTSTNVESLAQLVMSLMAAGVIGVALGTLHQRFWPSFAAAWREAGAALLLVGLFASAIPGLDGDSWHPSAVLLVGVVVAVLAAVASAVLASDRTALEPVAALAVGLVAVVLALWQPPAEESQVTLGDWLHAALAVVVYVVVSAGVAALGVLHDSWRLTALATAALVVFTTFQSFAVFARIMEGAWLFVLLGLIFLATGFAADRARRELVASLEGEAR
ncbi:MAG: DUF2157 domain-containing protein [Nocardioides sp.]|uniref:DUF2157 domain-containing protein n=1 Tax=Nocardioides sp. TaxID=35761 RepID=UPI0039E46910